MSHRIRRSLLPILVPKHEAVVSFVFFICEILAFEFASLLPSGKTPAAYSEQMPVQLGEKKAEKFYVRSLGTVPIQAD